MPRSGPARQTLFFFPDLPVLTKKPLNAGLKITGYTPGAYKTRHPHNGCRILFSVFSAGNHAGKDADRIAFVQA
jgi:hypothetical protein